MPDHVHLLFTPYEKWPLAQIMKRVKGVSARYINAVIRHSGTLWQDESFDRIVRADEDVRKKGDYISENPVRAGLVATPEEYPWLWRQWKTGNPASPAI
jgi:REP element-mobilizing transposase RayT